MNDTATLETQVLSRRTSALLVVDPSSMQAEALRGLRTRVKLHQQ
jgi:hypothetical protein